MIDLSKPVDKILAELIRIKSVSGTEELLAKEIIDTLKGIDIQAKRECGNNLIVPLNSPSKEKILLVGHLDTVPASREKQMEPYVKDGFLYGLGAMDMKSGLACMLKMAYDIKKGDFSSAKQIVLVFYEGEEVPLPNGLTRILDEKKIGKADFAFVLEPTDGEYHIGCLGSLTAEVKIKGKASHSANPKSGKNAIYLGQAVINRVKKFKDKEVKVGLYTVTETMNITRANTKNAHNVVPGEFDLVVNYRFAPGRSIQDAEKTILSAIKPGKDVEVTFIDESASCVAPLSTEKYLMKGIKKDILRGWTDIAQLNAAGIPAINYCSGELKVAHTVNERASIKDLRNFYESLKKHLS